MKIAQFDPKILWLGLKQSDSLFLTMLFRVSFTPMW